MTNRTAATRYARALVDVATKESANLDVIARELDEFSAFFSAQPALEKILLNPAVPAPRKRAAVEQITAVSQLTPIVAKLLVMLADRDRLEPALLRERDVGAPGVPPGQRPSGLAVPHQPDRHGGAA